ncbi:hypothetical protein J1605_013201 [Eschrichtius robustus]|uniref:Uncharacterized protein n=1 Tax=Eschrichtius robustus TaxID=9764 RepID=A0AB34GFG6_ESCRO|nr:hypothetical protein J1605_013201 [Eschrichtius robustus]
MYSSSGDKGSGSSLHSGELWLCSARVLFWEALLAVAPERIPVDGGKEGSLQTRNYISQKPAEQTRENYYSQESPRRRARSLVALLLGAESGRAELGSPLHAPTPSPNSAL